MSVLRVRLQKARKLGKLSQSELSRRCGFARQYIALIESGARTEVGPSKIVAIVIVLGLTADWLLLGKGEPPTAAQVRAAAERAHRDPDGVKNEIERALGFAQDASVPKLDAVAERFKAGQVEQLDEQRPKPGARKGASSSPAVEATPS